MSDEAEKSYIEKRQDERVVAKLEITFQRLTEDEARADMQSGKYRDVFAGGNLNEGDVAEEDSMKAFTENISISGLKLIGDLQLVGGEPLTEGMALRVAIQVPEAPQTIAAIARVVWTAPAGEGRHTAGLFFEAINKSDVDKVSRFLVLHKKAQMGR